MKDKDGEEIKVEELVQMETFEDVDHRTPIIYAESSEMVIMTISPTIGSTNKLLDLEHMISR
jgi:hypothetical protein